MQRLNSPGDIVSYAVSDLLQEAWRQHLEIRHFVQDD